MKIPSANYTSQFAEANNQTRTNTSYFEMPYILRRTSYRKQFSNCFPYSKPPIHTTNPVPLIPKKFCHSLPPPLSRRHAFTDFRPLGSAHSHPPSLPRRHNQDRRRPAKEPPREGASKRRAGSADIGCMRLQADRAGRDVRQAQSGQNNPQETTNPPLCECRTSRPALSECRSEHPILHRPPTFWTPLPGRLLCRPVPVRPKNHT